MDIQEKINTIEALNRLKEERSRIHKLCNKLSQIQEEVMVQTERIHNLQKQILGETETYNPRD